MASIDYALLAEFARVDAGGLLTIVGASFDHVRAAGPNSAQQLFVVVRVHLDEGEHAVPLDVRVVPPSQGFQIGFSGLAEPSPDARPMDSQVAVVSTFGIMAPLPEEGRYEVSVTLGSEDSRSLPFVVEFGDPPVPQG